MLTVNLTTTHDRLYLCRIALLSISLQSLRPDRVNVWISKDGYLSDAGIADLDSLGGVLNYVSSNFHELVCVRYTDNIGPYRKLIPALREAASDDVIVTADDDQFYGENWLKLLVDNYSKNNTAVAARVREKKYNNFNSLTSYKYWDIITSSRVMDKNFVVTFGGGAVLTQSMFRSIDVIDDEFLNIAPTADDLWYSKLLELAGTEVAVVSEALSEITPLKHGHGLVNVNLAVNPSLFRSLLNRFWFPLWGALGGSTCANDVCSKNIDRYFNG